MRILVVGNADSIWVKTLIEHTMIPFNDRIAIVSIRNKVFKEYYSEKGISVFSPKTKNRKLAKILSVFIFMSRIVNDYELITFQFLSDLNLCLLPIAKMAGKRTVLVAWGSDVLRKNRFGLAYHLAFKMTDKIALNGNRLNDKFVKMTGSKYINKSSIVKFGSPSFERFKEYEFSEKDIRKKLNIGLEKVIISIGQNSNPLQQHLKVIDSIKALDEQHRRNIHILLKMTYGTGGDEYINTVYKEALSTGCSVMCFREFLTVDELIDITSITDIFIQAQPTDVLSSTMCEHLYCGSLVINPEWLSYPELEEDIFYLQYKDFDSLTCILKDNLFLKSKSKYVNETKQNRDRISRFLSWDYYIDDWRKIYKN
ncbi:glycosyltransferase [Butyrivibrio sp. MC2013]|uniref:glycosyltransferase n=1 Tax=Butyrivibrio sp. MC2013 TaxID=1280686 RepID=UPI000428E4F3|nr:glycosyltransferase [Butyrivibrio sp. MC2013]